MKTPKGLPRELILKPHLRRKKCTGKERREICLDYTYRDMAWTQEKSIRKSKVMNKKRI